MRYNQDMAECNPRQRRVWATKMQEAVQCVEGRWKLLIIAHLNASPAMRLSELGRAMPEASQKMLIQQLRGLERDGIVARTVFQEVPPRVEYELTSLGRTLGPSLKAMEDWADQRETLRTEVPLTKGERAPWQVPRVPL